jgi:signal peptidase
MINSIRNHPRAGTIGRALLVIVLLATIAPFVVYAVPGTVGAEASYIVLTASMTPAIGPGDVVVVDDVRAGDVGVGDVIVFEQRRGDAVPVTHRVTAVESTPDGDPAFRTKGDANEDADLTLVTPDRLVGRVAFTIPFIGHVIQFVGTPAGFVALVLLPLGLLVVSEVADLLRQEGTPDVVSAASDEEAAESTPITSTPIDGQFTVSQAELTLVSVVLGAATAYASYVVLQRPTALSVSVAVAAGACLAVAVGMRTLAPASTPVTDGEVRDAALEVWLDPGPTAGPVVEVASPASLHGIARAVGRPLLRAIPDQYVVLDGPVTYVCPVPPDVDEGRYDAEAGDESEPAGEATADATTSESEGVRP